jgi:hypothetical protein
MAYMTRIVPPVPHAFAPLTHAFDALPRQHDGLEPGNGNAGDGHRAAPFGPGANHGTRLVWVRRRFTRTDFR